jgi:hypothetical protein
MLFIGYLQILSNIFVGDDSAQIHSLLDLGYLGASQETILK